MAYAQQYVLVFEVRKDQDGYTEIHRLVEKLRNQRKIILDTTFFIM